MEVSLRNHILEVCACFSASTFFKTFLRDRKPKDSPLTMTEWMAKLMKDYTIKADCNDPEVLNEFRYGFYLMILGQLHLNTLEEYCTEENNEYMTCYSKRRVKNNPIVIGKKAEMKIRDYYKNTPWRIEANKKTLIILTLETIKKYKIDPCEICSHYSHSWDFESNSVPSCMKNLSPLSCCQWALDREMNRENEEKFFIENYGSYNIEELYQTYLHKNVKEKRKQVEEAKKDVDNTIKQAKEHLKDTEKELVIAEESLKNVQQITKKA